MESSLHSVVECSNNSKILTTEMIELLMLWRRQRKAQQLMQDAFFGSLELEIFSSFEPAEESLVGLQRNLAARFIPHDLPSHKDISPLKTVFQENGAGRNIAMYRYLFCEVTAAGLFRSFVQEDSVESSRPVFVDSPKLMQLGRDLRAVLLEPGARIDLQKLRTFGGNATGSTESLLTLLHN